MPHRTAGPALHNHYSLPELHNSPDFKRDAHRPSSGPRPNMSRFEDFLSPAEAQFAFDDDEHREAIKEQARRDGHRNSWLGNPTPPPDGQDGKRYSVPSPAPLRIVSPLSHEGREVNGAGAQMDGRQAYSRPQLSVLDEEPALLVPIFVHLKTNVIVKDEFRLVTELSDLLARIFFCSQDAITISIDHSACLMFAATFAPAYIINLSTTSSQLELERNSANTAELQSLMLQLLKVPSHRGIVRYQAILEADIGYKGTTVAHHNLRASRELSKVYASGMRPGQVGVKRHGSTALDSNPVVPQPSHAGRVLSAQISLLSEDDAKTPSLDDREPVSPTLDYQPSLLHDSHLEPSRTLKQIRRQSRNSENDLATSLYDADRRRSQQVQPELATNPYDNDRRRQSRQLEHDAVAHAAQISERRRSQMIEAEVVSTLYSLENNRRSRIIDQVGSSSSLSREADHVAEQRRRSRQLLEGVNPQQAAAESRGDPYRPRPISAYSARMLERSNRNSSVVNGALINGSVNNEGAANGWPAIPNLGPGPTPTGHHHAGVMLTPDASSRAATPRAQSIRSVPAADYLVRPASYDEVAGGMPAPPPIPQGKKPEGSTKARRRKSIFSVFRR